MKCREEGGLPEHLREWPEPGDPGLRAFYQERLVWAEQYGQSVAMVMIEYRAEDFAETCTTYGATHAVVLRDRDLTPNGVHGWC